MQCPFTRNKIGVLIAGSGKSFLLSHDGVGFFWDTAKCMRRRTDRNAQNIPEKKFIFGFNNRL
jgi:hypothetical protein